MAESAARAAAAVTTGSASRIQVPALRPQAIIWRRTFPDSAPGTDGVAIFEGRVIGRVRHLTAGRPLVPPKLVRRPTLGRPAILVPEETHGGRCYAGWGKECIEPERHEAQSSISNLVSRPILPYPDGRHPPRGSAPLPAGEARTPALHDQCSGPSGAHRLAPGYAIASSRGDWVAILARASRVTAALIPIKISTINKIDGRSAEI